MVNKKRIIAFMNAYSHGKSGGDMVFIEIVKRVSNWDKLVITSRLGKKLCEENDVKATFITTSNERIFSHTLLTYITRTIRGLFLNIKSTSGDIYLGTSDFFPDVFPILFLKLKHRNIKWIQHIFHIIPRKRFFMHLLQLKSFFFIKHFANHIIVDNSLLRDELIAMGFDYDKITVNYPGIDTKKLDMIKPTSENKYDAVFMAQLRPQKGLDDLVKIWQKVNEKLPHARLAIIGKGEKKIRENIEYLGYVEDDEAFPIIKSSSLFLFPSHEEGFGIAAVQAQALGLPIIAWNLAVFNEIFPKGMICIEEGNIDRFAQEVVHLLTDSHYHRTLSREAVQNSKRFDWDKTADREIEIISKLV